MAYSVYILQSEVDGSYYKGFTENYKQRLDEHNAGLSQYTNTKKPWKLVYLEFFQSKSEALIREKNLKKYSHNRLISLINSPKNSI